MATTKRLQAHVMGIFSPDMMRLSISVECKVMLRQHCGVTISSNTEPMPHLYMPQYPTCRDGPRSVLDKRVPTTVTTQNIQFTGGYCRALGPAGAPSPQSRVMAEPLLLWYHRMSQLAHPWHQPQQLAEHKEGVFHPRLYVRGSRSCKYSPARALQGKHPFTATQG